jgi:hypothetical protein
MKTKLIPLTILAATAFVARAQQPSAGVSAGIEAAPAAENANHNHSNAAPKAGSAVIGFSGGGIGSTSAEEAPTSLPAGRIGQRLAGAVRRGDATAGPGTIILTSPMPQKDADELAEDLTVLNFIFARNLERTFGESGTEYRLGVPITMRDTRLIETSYLQDFGVLVKVHVPFAVFSTGENEKKPEPTTSPNGEWEKARRAVYGDADPTAGSPGPIATAYNERLVSELKRQIFDALKNAANIRHLEGNQNITVAILGGANSSSGNGYVGGYNNPSSLRPTILSMRISKAQADDAAKSAQGADELAKEATVVAYLDTASPGHSGGGSYGVMSGFGGGVGAFGTGYGYYPSYSQSPAAR